MNTVVTQLREPPVADRSPRFERVAVSCVFGDPRNPRSWSGAPANVSNALERLGVVVEAIYPKIGKLAKFGVALQDMLTGHGRPVSTEQVLRSLRTRRLVAREVARQAEELGVRHVLHTGTLDLPASDLVRGTRHYLYCDHSWALARLHHVHADRYSRKALQAFEATEREALAGLSHVFTFGAFVRDNIISHYGLPADRVTAVGSGMGAIEPWFGTKDFSQPSLLFVAKHLFQAKGGLLLLEAFDLARAVGRISSSRSWVTSAAGPSSAIGRASNCAPICRGPSFSGSTASRPCSCSRCSTTPGGRSISRP